MPSYPLQAVSNVVILWYSKNSLFYPKLVTNLEMNTKKFCTLQAATASLSLLVFSIALGAGQQDHQAPASHIIDQPFQNAVAFVETHLDRLYQQIAGFAILPQTILEQWRKVAESQPPLQLLALIALTIVVSIAMEYFIRRSCSSFHNRLGLYPKGELLPRVWNTIFATCLEVIYAATYILISFTLYIIILPESGDPEIIASNYIVASYYVRLLLFITIGMLSPARPGLRILPYSDDVARFMFRWITTLCGIEIILVRSGIILKKLTAPENAFLALVAIIIISTAITLALMIIKCRHWVARALTEKQSAHIPVLPIQATIAVIWHIPALILVICITCIWELRVLGSGQVLFGRVIIGLLAIPLFGAFDIWGQYLLSAVLRKAGAKQTKLNLTSSIQYLQLAYRILLLTLLVFLLLGLWNLDIPYGRMFTGSMLGIVAIAVITYMTWQFFSDWVDGRIKTEIPEESEDADEGGSGGSRTGTLLMLLRKFVFIILLALALMFSLSASGVNIGPLIAGAGILGLAISFGAQSLVTDIFAGIFFLIDDAFRVGDYIDIGTAKGTVDHISLRAVRLRHHLGMIQTIPFGKIDSVTNYSRDYIIMKLELRVRYDTDVDKVRKIIKKIYQQLMADETYGPKLIGKLKSQGVKHMDDSAMIMRVKFTTPPGEQFIMRQEILRRIQEAFADNNIEFAHRNVTVYMPSEAEDNKDHLRTLSGSAAGSVLLDEEIENQGNTDDDR